MFKWWITVTLPRPIFIQRPHKFLDGVREKWLPNKFTNKESTQSKKLLVVCCGLPTAFRIESGRGGWAPCRSDHRGILGGNQGLKFRESLLGPLSEAVPFPGTHNGNITWYVSRLSYRRADFGACNSRGLSSEKFLQVSKIPFFWDDIKIFGRRAAGYWFEIFANIKNFSSWDGTPGHFCRM